ncbi:hypothetical protein HPB51_010240 [Rhipicephalus microplus]|uniref:Uncharacterized protein n=1 Tax=Rhipicephalus microplus TaxID=6941 RepID=A0A9J6EGG5_RHIMP|nr:hypothetical protein HPB51_010240 [Rhipicephalus microplus]
MRNARNFRHVYARRSTTRARYGRSATARASEKRRRCSAARREAWKPQMCAKVALRSHCIRNKGGTGRNADDSRSTLLPSACTALSDTLRKRAGSRRRGDDRDFRMYCALNAHVLRLPLRASGIHEVTKHQRPLDDTALGREAHAADLPSNHRARHSRVSNTYRTRRRAVRPRSCRSTSCCCCRCSLSRLNKCPPIHPPTSPGEPIARRNPGYCTDSTTSATFPLRLEIKGKA